MGDIIVCFRGRCSTWGKSWNKHIWTIKEVIESDIGENQVVTRKSDKCWRCGMTKKEARND